jgi:poly(hydroxyalkanoate) granule-associated protein
MRKIAKQGMKRPAVRQSAQQIWLAGLGAFALAQEEGGKLFGTLVKKGHEVQKVNRARLQQVVTRVERARVDAGRTLGRLTTPFDFGTGTVLHRLGVPTRKEIVTLTKRVEELTRSVERAKAKPRKRAPAKPAAPAAV